MTVNGQQGPIAVAAGDSVTYHWVVVASVEPPSRIISVTIDDDTYAALDGACSPYTGTCEQSTVVTLSTPGTVINTVTANARANPPGFPVCCSQDQDSTTVTVGGVGGLAIAPQVIDGSGGVSIDAWPVAGGAMAVLALLVVSAVLYHARRS